MPLLPTMPHYAVGNRSQTNNKVCFYGF